MNDEKKEILERKLAIASNSLSNAQRVNSTQSQIDYCLRALTEIIGVMEGILGEMKEK